MIEDYPRTQLELEQRFGTVQSCRDYLSALRWPSGVVCPRCNGDSMWKMSRGLWLCRGCRRQVSVTAGTIFQDSHLPLTLWFRVMWHVASQKTGVSALGVQRALGIGSYKTAWAWLHKLRRAMVRPGRDRLHGTVEVDETYLGGLEEGVVGRQTERKALIAVAAEEDGNGIGRIRLQHIPDASSCSLHRFILASVKRGSVVHSDGWEGYNGIELFGYTPKVTVLSRRKKKPHELMPRVHRVASLLKRWILGTHQGAISHDHLEYYLDEFTFRFNRRGSASRGKLFFRLAQQAMQVGPAPMDTLLKPRSREG